MSAIVENIEKLQKLKKLWIVGTFKDFDVLRKYHASSNIIKIFFNQSSNSKISECLK